MKSYMILVNGGVYYKSLDGSNVFSRVGLEKEFEEWTKGKVMIDEYGEEVTIDDLIEVGDCGERINVVNEEMVEMSDVGGWVELSIVEIII